MTLDKREKLSTKHEDAKLLKQDIDKRSEQVAMLLRSNLTEEEFSDYSYFVKMKSKLTIEFQELKDKITLGQEQMEELRRSIPSHHSWSLCFVGLAFLCSWPWSAVLTAPVFQLCCWKISSAHLFRRGCCKCSPHAALPTRLFPLAARIWSSRNLDKEFCNHSSGVFKSGLGWTGLDWTVLMKPLFHGVLGALDSGPNHTWHWSFQWCSDHDPIPDFMKIRTPDMQTQRGCGCNVPHGIFQKRIF